MTLDMVHGCRFALSIIILHVIGNLLRRVDTIMQSGHWNGGADAALLSEAYFSVLGLRNLYLLPITA